VLLDAAETKSRDQSAAFETGEAFEKIQRMHALFEFLNAVFTWTPSKEHCYGQ